VSLLARALVLLASPMVHLDVRSEVIERLLGLPLTQGNVEGIRASGRSATMGRYYHWYLQKLAIAKAIDGMDKAKATAFIEAIDRTDYAPAASLLESRSGVLVAIPHHAHYILTMTALAAHVGRHRPVKVFYASPAKNAGNLVFDRLHAVLFSDPSSGVDVIHDNRQGLARAIKGLDNGDVVFIMPDAYRDVAATMMLPFCGRLTSVMLGTAALARKTGSWILPVVSRSVGRGLAFGAHFASAIHPASPGSPCTRERERIADYGVMRQVFAQFETVMANELLLWQSLRQHVEAGPALPALVERDRLDAAIHELRSSPWFREPDLVLDLRTR
jgi:hypothetical protein